MAESSAPRSLTAGELRPVVFRLALPVLAEQLLSYLVGLVDTYLSGRLGAAETNAVGLAAYVSWLGSLIFGLVGAGTTAIVARAWGAGRRSAAVRVANQALTLGAFLGLAFLTLMLVFAPAFAAMLDMDAATSDIAARYLRIDAVGLVATSVTLAAAAALRGAGDMRTPMLVLGLVNVLNVVCSTALVYGVGPWATVGLPPLLEPRGVDGIVLGTVIARFAGGGVMLYALSRGVGGLRLRPRLLRPKAAVARRILAVGLPAAADGGLMWFGHFLFLMIIARLADGDAGRVIFAAHIVGIRVEAITYLPALAWGAAAATLVGQNLGAGRVDRARAVGHEAARQCALLGAAFTAVFALLPGPIYAAMHTDPAVWAAGVPALRLLAFFQVPLTLSIVYVAALRGAGDTRRPFLITAVSVIGVRLPLSYLCGVTLGGGLVGAWVGMCGDILVRAVLASVRYARGRWVETRV